MEWRWSPSFPLYEVSEDGAVRRSGRLLKPWVREDGYRMYILRREGRSIHKKAHQLVCEAFVGLKPFPEAEVCHNDGTRNHDHWTNLRWDTRSANHQDKRRHGTSAAGENSPHAKLTRFDVIAIRGLGALGVLHKEIAERFGVKQPAVSRIIRGERWNTLGGYEGRRGQKHKKKDTRGQYYAKRTLEDMKALAIAAIDAPLT